MDDNTMLRVLAAGAAALTPLLGFGLDLPTLCVWLVLSDFMVVLGLGQVGGRKLMRQAGRVVGLAAMAALIFEPAATPSLGLRAMLTCDGHSYAGGTLCASAAVPESWGLDGIFGGALDFYHARGFDDDYEGGRWAARGHPSLKPVSLTDAEIAECMLGVGENERAFTDAPVERGESWDELLYTRKPPAKPPKTWQKLDIHRGKHKCFRGTLAREEERFTIQHDLDGPRACTEVDGTAWGTTRQCNWRDSDPKNPPYYIGTESKSQRWHDPLGALPGKN